MNAWQPDMFGGIGIVREAGKDRADELRKARQEMRDTNSADLFDAMHTQEFRGPCGLHHVYSYNWNARISSNKNWMYMRIAREEVEDACQACVTTRGYYVRPENRRKPLP